MNVTQNSWTTGVVEHGAPESISWTPFVKGLIVLRAQLSQLTPQPLFGPQLGDSTIVWYGLLIWWWFPCSITSPTFSCYLSYKYNMDSIWVLFLALNFDTSASWLARS